MQKRRDAQQDEGEHVDGAGPTLSDLSWSSKWWPFQVVPPASEANVGATTSAKGKGKTSEPAPAAAEAMQRSASAASSKAAPKSSFLELLAGKGAVKDAAQARLEIKHADAAENELLDADLATLATAATQPPPRVGSPSSSTPRTSPKVQTKSMHPDHQFNAEGPYHYREADESSPRMPDSFPFADMPNHHQQHYLPTSHFSSSPQTQPAQSTSARRSSLDGPAAMFSSLFSSNPFGPTSPGESVSGRPNHHRSFSSTSAGHRERDAKNAEKYIDEEDTKAVDDS